jgi:hypothetical protein
MFVIEARYVKESALRAWLKPAAENEAQGFTLQPRKARIFSTLAQAADFLASRRDLQQCEVRDWASVCVWRE